MKTYTKVLDVVEDLIVQGEVVARDDVDASILLDLPVSKTKALGLGQEIGLRDLATPVCVTSNMLGELSRMAVGIKRQRDALRSVLTSLGGLLQVTQDSHAGETENRGLNHLDRLGQRLSTVCECDV